MRRTVGWFARQVSPYSWKSNLADLEREMQVQVLVQVQVLALLVMLLLDVRQCSQGHRNQNTFYANIMST
jgi:hypothetical protein